MRFVVIFNLFTILLFFLSFSNQLLSNKPATTATPLTHTDSRTCSSRDLQLSRDVTERYECLSYYWKCSNGKVCIDARRRCDGTANCDDGSDEHGCDGMLRSFPSKTTCSLAYMYVHARTCSCNFNLSPCFRLVYCMAFYSK